MTMYSVDMQRAPSAEDLAQEARVRGQRFTAAAVVLSLVCGASTMAILGGSLIPPFIILVLIALCYLTWRFPRTVLYTTFASVCLFEIFQTPYPDALMDRVPFFWNVNSIIQVYARANFKAVPLNLCEVFLIGAGTCSLLKAIYERNFSLRLGPLFLPIVAYIGFVVLAFGIGMATGGDFKIALQETRAQFYFLLAYLMGLNLVTDRKHVRTLFWITAVTIAIKGILYTYRRYVTLAGLPLPDQGVGSHEEAFLFDAFVLLLVTLTLCAVHPRMRAFMWALLPLVIIGNLATNRRAATAAMVVAIPCLILTAYRCLPRRRTVAAVIGIFLAITGPIYYQAFKNSESIIAQPARAIRSQFQPDERDLNSNMYRDAENANILATMKAHPIFGYGYGKRFYHVVPIADISGAYDWWDILPHNQILWVWMRVGTVGFWVFWMMIAGIVLYLCGMVRRDDLDDEGKAVGIFALVSTGILLIFGLLDLQLSNFRDMLFVGFWIGTAAAGNESGRRAAAGAAAGELPGGDRESGSAVITAGDASRWRGGRR